MQKWKKNEIFEAIQAVGLDPKEFDLEDADGEVQIKHKWSTSCFTFADDPSHYVGRYVVGDGPDWPFEAYSWQAVIPRISRWLGEVKDDLETPDLWAELERDARLIFGAASDDLAANTPFTRRSKPRLRLDSKHWRNTRGALTRSRQRRCRPWTGSSNTSLTLRVASVGKIGSTSALGRSLFTSSRHRFHRRLRVTCS
jgi:hypothetical protein